MNATTVYKKNDVIEGGLDQPAISIILPFEPKMEAKSEILDRLNASLEKVQRVISANHRDELGSLVMQKLKTIFKNLNYSTYKKSIAIYVSPIFEKVLYLDFVWK